MNRYTIKQLDEMDDIDFAIRVLSERSEGLNYFSPLSRKILKTQKKLSMLKHLSAIPKGDIDIHD